MKISSVLGTFIGLPALAIGFYYFLSWILSVRVEVPQPAIVESVYGIREMEIHGCEYLCAIDAYNRYSVITHKGNCKNPIHRAVTCSWYGAECEGNATANGETFDPSLLTAASRQHPLGTMLRVTFEGHSVIVRVNDRTAPRYADRLDLSRAAFQQLAPLDRGVIQATVELVP